MYRERNCLVRTKNRLIRVLSAMCLVPVRIVAEKAHTLHYTGECVYKCNTDYNRANEKSTAQGSTIIKR